MTNRPVPATMTVVLLALLAALPLSAGEDAGARLIGEALTESRAWDKLAWLTDRIGHRLSGSKNLERAVAWAEEQFRRDGLEKVWTEPVPVPHWVRGTEVARIVEPVEAEIAMTTLGGSVPTPTGGLTAEVVVVGSFDELEALGETVRGRIVLYDRKMERGFAAENGYGALADLRVHGASRAARQGAVASLVRSLGTADFRLPHTGTLRYEDDTPQIPSAAIASEDAMRIARLVRAGETVKVFLDLGCKTLPDAPSANVLAEITGRERPQEIVVIGAHLDSWDVGTGAQDDGAGVAVVMETMRLLNGLERAPRRTVRAVLFTNEENGLRGGKDYAERHRDEMPNHVAAIESDLGAGPPMAYGVAAGEGGLEMMQAVADRLAFMGADRVLDFGGGADISPMKDYGVPQIGQFPNPDRYFDWHHTAADTLDKIDRHDLDRNVAALALAAWTLAEQPETLPRIDKPAGTEGP